MEKTEKKIRATDGVSRRDLLGTLRAYEALFDSLGFAVRLEPDEFRPACRKIEVFAGEFK